MIWDNCIKQQNPGAPFTNWNFSMDQLLHPLFDVGFNLLSYAEPFKDGLTM